MGSERAAVEVPLDLVEAVRTREKWGGGLESGVRMSMAVGLFAERAVSLARAAELAGIGIREFEAFLLRAGFPVVNYTETDLVRDLAFVRENSRD